MQTNNLYKFFSNQKEKVFFHLPFSYVNENYQLLSSLNNRWELFFSQDVLDNYSYSEIVENIDKLGGKKFTVHAPFNDLNPGSSDKYIYDVTMLRHVQLKKITDIIKPLKIVIHPGYENWRYNFKYDKWLNNAVNFFRDITSIYADTTVVVENVFETTPENLVRLMEKLNSENLGICLDIGHQNLFSEVDFQTWWKDIKPWVKHLHIHDNNGKRDEHLPPGRGNIDWNQFLEAIKELDLTYTFEMHSIEDIKFVLSKTEEINV